MISSCPQCDRKTRQIDASVYAGDYHGGDHYAPGRQCTECGTVYEVQKIGKTKRLHLISVHRLPPRNQWEEPQA
jgi:uncharacterized Zn finger protein